MDYIESPTMVRIHLRKLKCDQEGHIAHMILGKQAQLSTQWRNMSLLEHQGPALPRAGSD